MTYQKAIFRQSENISHYTRMQKRPYCIAKQYISWHEMHRIMPWYRLFHWLIQTISQDEEKYTALSFKRKRITISWLLTNVQSRHLSRKTQPTWFDFKIWRFQRHYFNISNSKYINFCLHKTHYNNHFAHLAEQTTNMPTTSTHDCNTTDNTPHRPYHTAPHRLTNMRRSMQIVFCSAHFRVFIRLFRQFWLSLHIN